MLAPMLRTLIVAAARRAATDPRVQQAAIDMARRAAPHLRNAARNVGEVARETPPLRDPAAFARSLRERFGGRGR